MIIRLLINKKRLLPFPSVILNRYLTMPHQLNSVYGHLTTAHTFRLYLSHSVVTSRFATPWADPPRGRQDVAKSWKILEQSCRQIATVLRTSFEQDYPKVFLNWSVPPNPSQFGYLKVHSTEKKARFASSESLDSFVLLFAYISFRIAICRAPDDPATISLSTSTQPRYHPFDTFPLHESRLRPQSVIFNAGSKHWCSSCYFVATPVTLSPLFIGALMVYHGRFQQC